MRPRPHWCGICGNAVCRPCDAAAPRSTGVCEYDEPVATRRAPAQLPAGGCPHRVRLAMPAIIRRSLSCPFTTISISLLGYHVTRFDRRRNGDVECGNHLTHHARGRRRRRHRADRDRVRAREWKRRSMIAVGAPGWRGARRTQSGAMQPTSNVASPNRSADWPQERLSYTFAGPESPKRRSK